MRYSEKRLARFAVPAALALLAGLYGAAPSAAQTVPGASQGRPPAGTTVKRVRSGSTTSTGRTGDAVSLNPQPLPPVAGSERVQLNPQPLPPRGTLSTLNPQPLPPIDRPAAKRPAKRIDRDGNQ